MALRNISNMKAGGVFATESKPLVAKNKKLTNPVQQAPNMMYEDSFQSAIQIRTSSPISSSSSSHMDFDAEHAPFFPVYPPPASEQQRGPKLPKHVSIRELAYEKLRQQQQQPHQEPEPQMRSNGKLKLLAYNNFGHLTVHVIKGKHYRSGNVALASLDTYVRISMLPDHARRLKQCQTSLVRHNFGSKRQLPVSYDEKFSFEVDSRDYANRLVVSVWAKSSMCRPGHSMLSSNSSGSSASSSSLLSESRTDQLLGCFSFRIKHLMSGKQSMEPQWYHLLPEQVGIVKHFRCHRAQRQPSVKHVQDTNELTGVNKDLIGLDKLKFYINRVSPLDSYGFTITGNCPCMVGKVDTQKNAFQVGLRPGDFIASLNGRNVSRATCDSVVKLIKSCQQQLVVEVYRETAPLIQVAQLELPRNDMASNYYQVDQRAQQQRDYPMPQIKLSQHCLEVVPEEDEEVSTGEESYYGEQLLVSEPYSLPHFSPFKGDAFMRHVDSDVNSLEEDDEDPALAMRKCAAKQTGLLRHANIMSLKNLRLVNDK